MTAVSMSFQWTLGDVAMIDYSGDPLYFVEPSGKRHKAEIFVGVMPYSNYIFCVATLDQTRRSLDRKPDRQVVIDFKDPAGRRPIAQAAPSGS